jgi:ABC-2 type transport system ATP-binding protein
MIEVKNLVKKYPSGKVALNGISFEIGKDEICGYIGTNGAGKTTTVKILTGSMDFDEGEVFINGFDARKDTLEIKRITGYVPESQFLFNALTVTEFLEFIATVRGIDEKIIRNRIGKFSELFGFQENLKISVGDLSKGNKQKVLITSALLHDPELIYFDEPLNGLDADSIYAFHELVRFLSSKGKTIIYCSHILETIEKISSRIIIINEGEIVLNSKSLDLVKEDTYKGLEDLFRKLREEKEIKKFDYEQLFS